MSNLPRVAVITPVYNGAPFLERSMAHVQAQTYPNLVHVVLNNGSSDGTAEIIASFKDARVPVIVFENPITLPLPDNWNRAVSLGRADTQYFRILCADDGMPPDAIEKMVALAESDPNISVVCCLRQTVAGVEDHRWDKTRNVFDGRDVMRGCFLDGNGLAPPHALYRTSATMVREPFFDGSLTAFDTDVVFFLLSQDGAKFGYLHEPLGITARHKGSITEKEVLPFHKDYFEWLVLMSRHAAFGLDRAEFAKCKQAFVRHYRRRLLAWRWSQSNNEAFRWHLERLKSFGHVPRALDYADALLDYALYKFGMRERWNNYPQG